MQSLIFHTHIKYSDVRSLNTPASMTVMKLSWRCLGIQVIYLGAER